MSLRGFALAVNDFLELRPERRFVVRCFHALLGRDPSSEELERWARRVRSDWHRVPVLFAIRYSRGGRAAGVRIRVRWLRLVRDGAAHAVQVVRSRWRRR